MRPKEGRPQVAACPTLGIQLKKMSFVQSFVFAGDGLLYTSELCLEWQASEAGTALKEACGQTGKSQQRSFVEMWGWIVSRLKSSTKRLRNILIPNWKKKQYVAPISNQSSKTSFLKNFRPHLPFLDSSPFAHVTASHVCSATGEGKTS